MKVGQICTRGAVTVPIGASLEEAASKMLECGVGSIIVTDPAQGRPRVAGILTDRDIVRARLDHSGSLNAISAESVMTRDPLLLDEEETLTNALRALRARDVRRAPVLGRNGELLGLISSDDLLKEIAGELEGLAQLVTR